MSSDTVEDHCFLRAELLNYCINTALGMIIHPNRWRLIWATV